MGGHWIKLPNGKKMLLSETKSDGTVINYDNQGKISSVMSPNEHYVIIDGKHVTLSYRTPSGAIVHLDKYGKISSWEE